MLSHICGVYDKGAFKYDITPGGGDLEIVKKAWESLYKSYVRMHSGAFDKGIMT